MGRDAFSEQNEAQTIVQNLYGHCSINRISNEYAQKNTEQQPLLSTT